MSAPRARIDETTLALDDFVRFIQMTDVGSSPGACWLWKGTKPDGRYGHFNAGAGSPVKAHRWIYEFLCGPIPEGLVVRHRCDVPACVNPRHLQIGTLSDNSQDMVARGRNPNRKGERHPMARLGADDVRSIRSLSAGGVPCADLAQRFGVSRSQVQRIIYRRAWGHI